MAPKRAQATAQVDAPAGPRFDPLNVMIGDVSLSELVEIEPGPAGPRSKRALIIDTAVRRFGETGFENTKWSTISDEVGIGQTALYHYFESKAHCLLTIMRLELARSYQRLVLATHGLEDSGAALNAALDNVYDLTEAEVRQLRILMANGDVLVNPRTSDREEKERQACLLLTRTIEDAWTAHVTEYLSAARDPREPRIVARACLGLINSLWRWFRPGGRATLQKVSATYVDAAKRVLGMAVTD